MAPSLPNCSPRINKVKKKKKKNMVSEESLLKKYRLISFKFVISFNSSLNINNLIS